MDENDLETDLVDLTDVPLPDLTSLDDSVLGSALRRLVAEAKQPRDAIAGFNAVI